MHRVNVAFLGILSVVFFSVTALASELRVGDPAPAFSLVDSNAKQHSLAAAKGKWIVLEWLNHGCPFVRKHYDSKNMQALQEKYVGKGVVWYSVLSSAPGKQGYSTPAQANTDVKRYGGRATAVLMDTGSEMARKFGAQTTPHMFVIDPEGKTAYMGAIDDKPTTEISDIKGSNNYVAAALDAGMAGKPIAKAATKPYGCSVKY